VGSEDLLAMLLVDAVGQRELEALGEELLDIRATDVVGLLDLNDLQDLGGVNCWSGWNYASGRTYVNRPEARSVTGSHVLVQSIDGVSPRHLTVLLVHVVGAGARIVADPDTEVLDLLGALLVDLAESACIRRGQAICVWLAQAVYEPGSWR